MVFLKMIRICFRRYGRFGGRAGQAEFWLFWLLILLGGAIARSLDELLFSPVGFDRIDAFVGPIDTVFALVTTLPALAVTVRRLHDTGRRGWWTSILVAAFSARLLVPVADFPLIAMLGAAGAFGGFSMLVLVVVLLFTRGDSGTNRFGESPLSRDPVSSQPA